MISYEVQSELTILLDEPIKAIHIQFCNPCDQESHNQFLVESHWPLESSITHPQSHTLMCSCFLPLVETGVARRCSASLVAEDATAASSFL